LKSVAQSFWVETLGCPKNQVDSDKLTGTMLADGLVPASAPDEADVVVVNTCAFIDAARQESIDTVLALSDARSDGARVVVTGCMAERYGDELAEALPEVDAVAGFGVAVTQAPSPTAVAVRIGSKPGAAAATPVPSFDLLNLPRPKATAPWAYLKVAEGCDRNCGFCAIPSFRGKQRSRGIDDLPPMLPQEVAVVQNDVGAVGQQLLGGHPDHFAAREHASDVLLSADVRHRVAAEHRNEETIEREDHGVRAQLQLLGVGALAGARETRDQVSGGHS